jgi:hypothetical protein
LTQGADLTNAVHIVCARIAKKQAIPKKLIKKLEELATGEDEKLV